MMFDEVTTLYGFILHMQTIAEAASTAFSSNIAYRSGVRKERCRYWSYNMLGDGDMARVCHVFPRCDSIQPGTDTLGWRTFKLVVTWDPATIFPR